MADWKIPEFPTHFKKGIFFDDESDLLETGFFSDLTITCGQMEWKAHRYIVEPKSGWIKDKLGKYPTPTVLEITNFPDTEFVWLMDILYGKACPAALLAAPEHIFKTLTILYELGTFFRVKTLVFYAVEVTKVCTRKLGEDVINQRIVAKETELPPRVRQGLLRGIKRAYAKGRDMDNEMQEAFLRLVFLTNKLIMEDKLVIAWLDEVQPFCADIVQLMFDKEYTLARLWRPV